MYRVLIADDEMIERTILYRTIHKNLKDRCEIFQAENGREALEIYEREKTQIVILDIEMPGINGIEAAERIREKDRDTNIIFLTAYDEFSYAKKAITVRALDYLLKPYEEKELMLVLEEAIRLTEEHENRLNRVQDAVSQRTLMKEKSQWPEDRPEEGEEPEELGKARMGKVTEMILNYIQKNYMYDISMQEVARVMNYSEAYFCKLFKQCFSKNFTSYLTEYRVAEAKKMLEEPTVNVKDVGKSVGYMDSNYFARVFKRITGQTPTEYRAGIFQRKQ
ncbi:MAG: response regulator [Hungatella sp.]|jgi:two-component system response regulator YesN|nr:response regulator [Hungatella sp.]MCI9636132.1 response regulator [Hungatella sp.]